VLQSRALLTPFLAAPLRLCSLLVCLAVGLPATVYADPNVDALTPSVVRVRAIAADGALRLGSGVVVAPDRVATACHVTRNAASIQIVRGAGRWTAVSQTGSVARDVCILSTGDVHLDLPPAALRDSTNLRAGERVFAVSFQGARRSPLVSEGAVEALYDYDGAEVILTTATFDHGSSGGALLDQDGRVVGLLAFKSATDERRFAVPSEWIDAAARSAKVEFPLDPVTSTVAFWERSLFSRPAFLDIVPRSTHGP
jgi:S1-C subfamily serine protease